MKIRLYNIDWDTDGEDIDLPQDVIREVENDFDIINDGADLLSDEYGWCVFGFDYEILP